MKARHLLVADDVAATGESGKKRSLFVRGSARAMALKLGIGVDLLYVHDLHSRNGKGKLGQGELARLSEELRDRLSKAAQAMECEVDGFLKFGSPAEEIIRVSKGKARPELIVIGTRGLRGMERLWIGSVAEEVIRHVDRPVMVVGPLMKEVPDFLSEKTDRILVATELGRNSRPAEHYALSLARRLGAEVLLYHCLWDEFRLIQDGVMNSGVVAYDLNETFSELRHNAIETLKEKARYFNDRGVKCDYKVEEKSVLSRQAVHQLAKKGFSMIISGTRGRNLLMSAFFGSTVRETVLNSAVPVIVVRSP